MRCKRFSAVLAIAVVAMALFATTAHGALVDEDFQSPMYSNGTANPSFTGWTVTGKSRTSASQSDVPCDDHPTIPNQVIQFEYTSQTATSDISHNWAAGEAYTLTLNASPQDWHGADDRYIAPSLLQQDNTVLWSESVLMPKYDNFGRKPWTAEQTFDFLILSDRFTTGTEGEPLRLKIASAGARGTYIDNVSLTVGPPPIDNTPPSPDPLTWAVEPTLHGGDSISMTATAASDPHGIVKYLFENTVRGTSSGWQNGTTWSESGLDPATLYSYQYRVKARDNSPNLNETQWSSQLSAPQDLTPPTPSPMTWAFEPTALDGGCGRVTMTATTSSDPNLVEYYFENVTRGTNSGWQDGTRWTDSGLDPNALYTYQAKARDKSPDRNETAWSSQLSATTLASGAPLLDEGFQSPTYNNNTASPYFPGWTWENGGSVKLRKGGSDGAPGDSSNQLIQFEWTSAKANYDLCHNWSADDVYTLTLNASPQEWSGQSNRSFKASLSEEGGPLLWTSGDTALPKYDGFGGQPWTDALTFTFEILASDFATGTEGELLTLKIESSGSRGMYIDNVLLTFASAAVIPEPSTLAIWALGLIGLAWYARRRKRS